MKTKPQTEEDRQDILRACKETIKDYEVNGWHNPTHKAYGQYKAVKKQIERMDK